jgi:hypothetical protein
MVIKTLLVLKKHVHALTEAKQKHVITHKHASLTLRTFSFLYFSLSRSSRSCSCFCKSQLLFRLSSCIQPITVPHSLRSPMIHGDNVGLVSSSLMFGIKVFPSFNCRTTYPTIFSSDLFTGMHIVLFTFGPLFSNISAPIKFTHYHAR